MPDSSGCTPAPLILKAVLDKDELAVIQGEEQWSTCPYCHNPIMAHEITQRIEKWYDSRLVPQLPDDTIVGVPRHAHIECILRDLRYYTSFEVAPPDMTTDQCSMIIQECLNEQGRLPAEDVTRLIHWLEGIGRGITLLPQQQLDLLKIQDHIRVMLPADEAVHPGYSNEAR